MLILKCQKVENNKETNAMDRKYSFEKQGRVGKKHEFDYLTILAESKELFLTKEGESRVFADRREKEVTDVRKNRDNEWKGLRESE